jgi:hypothetical protein
MSKPIHRKAAAPLVASRRRWIQATAAGALCGLLGHPEAQSAAPGRSGSVLQFDADPSGKKDSSASFTEAIKQFDVVTVPAGTFQLGNIELRAGLTLVGAGELSIIWQKPGAAFAFICDSGSANPSSNVRGIAIKNLQLRGSCDTEGFSEHIHLLSLDGVSDALIEKVVFRGFRGDGFYLGSGHKAQSERHNQRVVVRDCLFDGINHENRNGLSVIDCDGLVVERCRFTRMTRHDMPGAIDLEPDANAFHVIRDIQISGNHFSDIGGSATIALYVPRQLSTLPTKIMVEDNVIEGTEKTAFAFVQLWAPPAGGPGQSIVMRNNRVWGRHARPFDLRGVSGVELRNNRFEGATQAAEIGNREARDAVRNIALRGNKFERCGSEQGTAVSVFNANLLVFAENEWIDCGNGKPNSSAVDFVDGASQAVSFSRNRFSSPRGKTLIAIRKEATHHFNADSNTFGKDNVIENNLANAFEARQRAAR